MFNTTNLPLAAYLKIEGFHPSILPPEDPTALITFQFEGDPAQIARFAEAFESGASTEAIQYYQALQALRAEMRYTRGGGR